MIFEYSCIITDLFTPYEYSLYILCCKYGAIKSEKWEKITQKIGGWIRVNGCMIVWGKEK